MFNSKIVLLEDAGAEQSKEKTEEIQDKQTPSEELPEQPEVDTDTAHDVPQSQTEETPATTDDTGTQEVSQVQNTGQESTYANLQPIFLAMEMGQQQGEQTTTTAEITQSTHAIHSSQAITEHTNQMVLSQQVLSNLATSVAEGTTSVSLQSILQVSTVEIWL